MDGAHPSSRLAALIARDAFAFIFHFACQEIVECGADDGDGSEFADLSPAWRDGSREDVRAELKFEGEREITRQRQTNTVLAFDALLNQRAKELITRNRDAHPYDERADGLDDQLEPLHGVRDHALRSRRAR